MGRITRKTRHQSMNRDDFPSPKRRRVGLLYDDRMSKHFDFTGHVENPDRILSIWNKLQSSGINQRCIVLSAKEAADRHVASVHDKRHVDLIKSISSPTSYDDLKRNRVANCFDSIYFNEGSSEAAFLAAGSVVELAEKVAKGELDSGFAIVRPPGHHAEANKPKGFCLLNNVAIAASYVLNERNGLGIRRILIVDWDVHHGNATQKMFWKDPRVLVFSVHRHENGTFYPGGDDGSYQKIGVGRGAGYNINVAWENDGCGDADYMAAWDHVLVPVARSFDPDLVIVASGFDAAINDPLGGCCVTPYGFSIMLSKLMEFAQGKIVLALEGGYNLESLANSSLACVETLLEAKPVAGSLIGQPLESTLRVIQAVREQLSPFWPILSNQLPLSDLSYNDKLKLIVDSTQELVPNGELATMCQGFVLKTLDIHAKDLAKVHAGYAMQIEDQASKIEDLERQLSELRIQSEAKIKELETKAIEYGKMLEKYCHPSVQINLVEAASHQVLKSGYLSKEVAEANRLATQMNMHELMPPVIDRYVIPDHKDKLLQRYSFPEAKARLDYKWSQVMQGGSHRLSFIEHMRSENRLFTPEELWNLDVGELADWNTVIPNPDGS